MQGSFTSLRFVPTGNTAYRWQSTVSTACSAQGVLDGCIALGEPDGLVNTELRHASLASSDVASEEAIVAFHLQCDRLLYSSSTCMHLHHIFPPKCHLHTVRTFIRNLEKALGLSWSPSFGIAVFKILEV